MATIIDGSFLEQELLRLYGGAGKVFYDARKPNSTGVIVVDTSSMGKVMTIGTELLESFGFFKKRLQDTAQRFVSTHPDFTTGIAAAHSDFLSIVNITKNNLKPIEDGVLARAEAELKIIHAPASEDSPSVTMQWLKFVEFLEKKGEAEGGFLRVQVLWRSAIIDGSEIAYIAARKLENTIFQNLCGANTDAQGPKDFRQCLIELWAKNKANPAFIASYNQLKKAIAATKTRADELSREATQLTGLGPNPDDELRALLREQQEKNKKVA